jgi:hypothetical protein
VNGANGTSGVNGANGTSGVSGTSGINGTNGTSVSVSGTTNKVVKFTSSSTIGDSIVTDNGTGISVSGTVTATSFFESSDLRLKNIVKRDSDVAYFKWKNNPDKIHIGYIAQEVQENNPDQVKEDENGMLSVNYIEMLVQKVRELEKEIENLKSK